MHIFSSANAPNCGRCCDTRLGGFQQPKILGSFTCLARGGSKMNHSEFESAISRREDRATSNDAGQLDSAGQAIPNSAM
jgi:hypothetical protein